MCVECWDLALFAVKLLGIFVIGGLIGVLFLLWREETKTREELKRLRQELKQAVKESQGQEKGDE